MNFIVFKRVCSYLRTPIYLDRRLQYHSHSFLQSSNSMNNPAGSDQAATPPSYSQQNTIPANPQWASFQNRVTAALHNRQQQQHHHQHQAHSRWERPVDHTPPRTNPYSNQYNHRNQYNNYNQRDNNSYGYNSNRDRGYDRSYDRGNDSRYSDRSYDRNRYPNRTQGYSHSSAVAHESIPSSNPAAPSTSISSNTRPRPSGFSSPQPAAKHQKREEFPFRVRENYFKSLSNSSSTSSSKSNSPTSSTSTSPTPGALSPSKLQLAPTPPPPPQLLYFLKRTEGEKNIENGSTGADNDSVSGVHVPLEVAKEFESSWEKLDSPAFSPQLESSVRAAIKEVLAVHDENILNQLWDYSLIDEIRKRMVASGVDSKLIDHLSPLLDSYVRTILEFKPQPASTSLPPSTPTQQKMIVLTSVPGGGKSYFCKLLLGQDPESDEKQEQKDDPSVSAPPPPPPLPPAVAQTPTTDPMICSPMPPVTSAHQANETQNEAHATYPSYNGIYSVSSNSSSSSSSSAEPWREWVRVNQDALGNRRACEIAAENALKQGKSVIIDRTNIDISQRRTWVNMARKYNLQTIYSVYLDVPISVCKQRVLHRMNHETLPPNERSLGVVDSFLWSFVPPLAEEGFTQLFTLSYSNDDLILRQRQETLIKMCNQ